MLQVETGLDAAVHAASNKLSEPLEEGKGRVVADITKKALLQHERPVPYTLQH